MSGHRRSHPPGTAHTSTPFFCSALALTVTAGSGPRSSGTRSNSPEMDRAECQRHFPGRSRSPPSLPPSLASASDSRARSEGRDGLLTGSEMWAAVSTIQPSQSAEMESPGTSANVGRQATGNLASIYTTTPKHLGKDSQKSAPVSQPARFESRASGREA